jgi:hypothetical protein
MPGFNGDIDAAVLRTGEVKNIFPGLEPRERNSIGPRLVRARAGSGGAILTFTVGDGTIQIGSVSSRQYAASNVSQLILRRIVPVVSWIESPATKNHPRNHTNNHRNT